MKTVIVKQGEREIKIKADEIKEIDRILYIEGNKTWCAIFNCWDSVIVEDHIQKDE